jgi:hypothetical protein
MSSLLLSGCTGKSQHDLNITVTDTAAGQTPAPQAGTYLSELSLGVADHSEGRADFENATTLWDNGDLANASELFKQADDEFSGASVHYHNMEEYALNNSEQEFAGDLEDSAIDMSMATYWFGMSIDDSLAGNNSEALIYFDEGQDFVNVSMNETNASLLIMPSLT